MDRLLSASEICSRGVAAREGSGGAIFRPWSAGWTTAFAITYDLEAPGGTFASGQDRASAGEMPVETLLGLSNAMRGSHRHDVAGRGRTAAESNCARPG